MISDQRQVANTETKLMSKKLIKTLLLIEDNPGDARLFRETFKEQDSRNTELTHVKSMSEAEKYLAAHEVDIIILDLGLPDAQGLTAVRRAHSASPRVPLVVLTGLDDESLAIQALQEGAQDYLIKGQIETRGLLRALRHSVERKIMDDALFIEKERAQVTLNSIGDAVVCTDIRGNITFLNLVAEKMTGWSLQQAAGLPMAEVCQILDATTRKTIPNPMERALGHNRTEHLQSNCVLIRLDRFEIPIEDSVAPIHDRQGQPTGAVIVFRDITERKQREDDLSRLAAVVESSYDGIFGLTPKGIILTWNFGAERIFGYSAGEAVGQSILFLSPPNLPTESPKLLEMAALAEAVEHLDTTCAKKDGTPVQVALTLSPIKNSNGQVVGVSGVARDITESKHLEEMLRRAQKMEAVGLLAGGIAHDFNNLLNVIIGYSEILLNGGHLDPKMHSKCEEIKKAGDRAASLTRQLLVFSRQRVLESKVLNLNTVVLETVKMLERLIGEDIEIQTTLDPTLGSVKANPGQIEQIIMNLVVNARDAMPEGGRLAIETSNAELDGMYAIHHPPLSAGRYVLLAVADTGIGMNKDTQSHIFEPFFTTKGLGKGTGLGLSTIYGVVKQSGGHIWVYSELGHGSIFKIYLPRVDEAVQQNRPSEFTPVLVRGTETVLLVEDEESVRTLTRSLLEEAGYKLIEARSGADALEITASYSGPIHLLLTDVVMPGMNGPDLAERLAVTHPHMKALFMSGYTGTFANLSGLVDRCVRLIEKPFSREILLRMVREVLESQVEVQPT
jgi:two-component system, cell cycle sensor histidine kinase and response regulator CckA